MLYVNSVLECDNCQKTKKVKLMALRVTPFCLGSQLYEVKLWKEVPECQWEVLWLFGNQRLLCPDCKDQFKPK